MWAGRSVAAVKPPQAVLPGPRSRSPCFQPHPGLFLDFFVWTPLASYGTTGQKERWTPMASCGGEKVKMRPNEAFQYEK